MNSLRIILIASFLIVFGGKDISSSPVSEKYLKDYDAWPVKVDKLVIKQQDKKVTETVLKTIRRVKVSFYADKFEGRETASGDIYDSQKLTAAHKTWPLGSVAKIFFNNKVVKVTINDRGPFVPRRLFDLSTKAFGGLTDLDVGVLMVDSVQLISVPRDYKLGKLSSH